MPVANNGLANKDLPSAINKCNAYITQLVDYMLFFAHIDNVKAGFWEILKLEIFGALL